MVEIVHKSDTACHTGTEVHTRLAEDHNHTAGHIFTGVIPCSLYDRDCTGVTHCKTLTDLPVDIEFSACGTIEAGIASE